MFLVIQKANQKHLCSVKHKHCFKVKNKSAQISEKKRCTRPLHIKSKQLNHCMCS